MGKAINGRVGAWIFPERLEIYPSLLNQPRSLGLPCKVALLKIVRRPETRQFRADSFDLPAQGKLGGITHHTSFASRRANSINQLISGAHLYASRK
ncbi:hypothetical protein [Trinickia acidisoli]|uniref:hypothetical protein n=1 Tax=Trinickia acidisoli TaxID=2767482 RepID=UPI001A8ECE59|nr:hypothetical protein [Trinickia acidisoli]